MEQQLSNVSAAQARESCISASTRKAYSSNLNVISKWIRETQENPARFFDSDGVIDVHVFTHEHFEAFLLCRINDTDNQVRVSTLSGYSSALKHLYRGKRLPVPQQYGEELKTLFPGLKRLEADTVQSGVAQHQGKAPLNYSKYMLLCDRTLMLYDGCFAHLFLTTQWNLMCRLKSVQTLDTSDITCEDDSVGCTFYKTKTNQDGSGMTDPSHIYANPFSPTTCWVTALGLYLACSPDQQPGHLFPGANQKNRFGKVMSRLLKGEGVMDKKYGTHSVRKGVATFACSGSTGGPSIVSVCLRCGWSLGSVQDRYLKYEAAGDQYLGRVVASLPLNKAEFAILPPHFADPTDPIVTTSIDCMFPSMSSQVHLRGVLSLCLASLAFHSTVLIKLLPATHSLLQSYAFRERGLWNDLRDRVSISDSCTLKPTGIPPHVEMYQRQRMTHEAVEKIRSLVLDGVSALLEEKGVRAGNITHDFLRTTIQDLIHDVRSTPSSTDTAPTATPNG